MKILLEPHNPMSLFQLKVIIRLVFHNWYSIMLANNKRIVFDCITSIKSNYFLILFLPVSLINQKQTWLGKIIKMEIRTHLYFIILIFQKSDFSRLSWYFLLILNIIMFCLLIQFNNDLVSNISISKRWVPLHKKRGLPKPLC